MDEEKPIKLNIYKLNDKINSLDDFLFPQKIPPYELEKEDLESDFQYRLYVQRSKFSTPQWVSLFGSLLKGNVTNSSASFVLVVKKTKNGKDYFFALTGGHTSYGMVHRYVEEEFGLNIAEKTIDPKNIKNISQTTFTGSDKQILRAVKGYNPAYDIESQRRILKSLQGKSINPELVGLSLSGADSLVVKKSINFDELGNYFDTIINLYEAKTETIRIQKTFHIIKKNKDLVFKLQEKLVENFISLTTTQTEEEIDSPFFIGYKDYFDLLRCNRFVISYGTKRVGGTNEDLEIDAIIKFVKDFNLAVSFDVLKSITVSGLGESDEEIIPPTGLLHFLYSEVSLDGKTYFLIDNHWYELDHSYKSFIDSAIVQCQVKKGELPSYKTSLHKNENQYNEWVPTQNNDIVCLDSKLTSYKVEICDLYSKTTSTFYHVKRAWGSKLSHLFAQGLVASQLFAVSQEFRDECHKKESQIDLEFKQSKNKVAFAFINKKALEEKFPQNMTYFSKVNFLDTASRIRALGFDVYLAPIMIE